MSIPQSVAFQVSMKVYLASDHVSPATGKTLAVTLSKAGGAFANPAAGASNATEVSAGWYSFALGTGDTGTVGDLIVRLTGTGVDDSERLLAVVNANTGGLLALPNVASGSAGAIPTTGTGANQIAVNGTGGVSHVVLADTATNLTNAPTAGDFTAAMKASVTAACPTSAQMATAVWTDTTAGDFTVASSIGKSLYTSGVAPGASGGLLISGVNTGTTTFGALTITGATTHTGTTTFTGNVSMAGGFTITNSSSGQPGLSITGNGGGDGLTIKGGTTSNAIRLAGGTTAGNAILAGTTAADCISLQPNGGHGMLILGNGTGKNGLNIQGPAGDGVFISGTGTSRNGMHIQGDVSGVAIGAYGGITGGIDLVTNLTNLPAVPTDWLTAAGVKADAVTKIQAGLSTYAGGAVTLAANQHVIVDSGTVTTLTNLPAIPANWLTATGIAAGALSGKGDWSTYAGADTSGVTTLLSRITGAVVLAGTAPGWYTAPDNADIALIKAKTDNLPASPANETLILAATAALAAQITSLGSPMQSGASVVLSSAGLDGVVVEAGINARQALSLIGAAAAGVLSGALGAGGGPTTIVMEGMGTSTVRIVVACDGLGNRNTITLSP